MQVANLPPKVIIAQSLSLLKKAIGSVPSA